MCYKIIRPLVLPFNDNDYIKAFSNDYVYGKDNRIEKVHFNQTNVDLNRTYDDLGRVTKKEYNKNGAFFSTEYAFLDGIDGNTTGVLSAINNNGEAISYTYDANGNIETISENGVEKVRYYYDGLNQLIGEDNKYFDRKISYKYDVGGNITSKIEYSYPSDIMPPQIKDIVLYKYGDSNWKDKLTSFDGKPITYDEIGNPLTFDGNTFSWTGRQLDGISGNGKEISYKYNAEGIRTEKNVNGEVTKYYLQGSRIVLEKTENEEHAFFYDANGQAAAFVIYDAAGKHPYYYIRNAQDDVIGFFDASGEVVVRYTYDSWGKLIKITDGAGNDKTNDTTFIGYKNPLRYREYYYDNETGMYYLQSRYYNPEICRFLNADVYASTGQGVLGSNVFAYCLNNPVILADPTGEASIYSPVWVPASVIEMHQVPYSPVWVPPSVIELQKKNRAPAPRKRPPTNGQIITCYFGCKNPAHHHVSSGHTGTDYAAINRGVAGEGVMAAMSGTVVYVGNPGDSGGKQIYIRNGRYELRYLHLSNYNVDVGDVVSPGQIVGFMGNTCNGKIPKTGVHLHFSVWDIDEERYIDPEVWLTT